MLVVFSEGAKVNFNLYGYLTPAFIGVIDGEPRIFPIVFEKPEDKDELAQKIHDLIASDRLKEYILVTEAWSANIQDGDQSKVRKWLETYGSLQNWLNRSEVAMVMYCSPNEEIDYTADIICGRISKVNIAGEQVELKTIGEWKISNRKVNFNIEDFTTRFQGLFLKGKAGQN